MPRFRGTGLTIVAMNVAFSFLALLWGNVGGVANFFANLALVPALVTHGYLWQLLTYSFLDLNPLSLLFSSFAIWQFGSIFEGSWGKRRLIELYALSVVFAGLVAVVLSYTHLFGTAPQQTMTNAWGGVFGLLGAFGTVFAEQETYLFPFQVPIKAKYLAMVWIGVAFLYLLGTRHILFLAELGGALFGYVYVKWLSGKNILAGITESAYALRNSYYRWRRRRAARKFQVYMKKHDRDVYFDQYGNYRPPDEEKGDDRGGWVN